MILSLKSTPHTGLSVYDDLKDFVLSKLRELEA
jgi:hypothetical protein